ncbi:MAG: methyltransferase domain-containing protein [Haloarculaceae archaeon]
MTGPSVPEFYGRWAALYDRIATVPGVGRWRRTAADALELSSGDTVVEMGCGTGANLPHLRRRVGTEGRVVGVDLTPELLAWADDRAPDAGLLRGDATRPPVAEADAVLGTFVTGMFADPAGVVEEWCELCSGRVALMDLSTTDRPLGRPLNPAFRAFTAASTPGSTAGEVLASVLPGAAAESTLARRVREGRDTLTDLTVERTFERFALGFCGLLSGRSVA